MFCLEFQSTVVTLHYTISALFECSFKHDDSSIIAAKQIDLKFNLNIYYN